jgi:hypothetical protein
MGILRLFMKTKLIKNCATFLRDCGNNKEYEKMALIHNHPILRSQIFFQTIDISPVARAQLKAYP